MSNTTQLKARQADRLPGVANMDTPIFRARTDAMRWQDVAVGEYKREHDAPFRDVTRQLLFDDPLLACQLRYFEVAPGGHTTLERHEHAHAVIIERGHGRCLVGERVYDVAEHDLVHVPPLTWHQFQADQSEYLGFLCMVNAARDRPQLPTAKDLERLRANPAVAAFMAPRSA
jgi:S-methyl-1-thioxylulose 5-phosphate methylthiotransferase